MHKPAVVSCITRSISSSNSSRLPACGCTTGTSPCSAATPATRSISAIIARHASPSSRGAAAVRPAVAARSASGRSMMARTVPPAARIAAQARRAVASTASVLDGVCRSSKTKEPTASRPREASAARSVPASSGR